jgi:hypothetical protein
MAARSPEMLKTGMEGAAAELPASDCGSAGANDSFEDMRAALIGPVGRIRSAMSAGGVVVAARDSGGIQCVASAGEPPPVSSRLHPDSTFTRECIESGEVVLCENTEGLTNTTVHREKLELAVGSGSAYPGAPVCCRIDRGVFLRGLPTFTRQMLTC